MASPLGSVSAAAGSRRADAEGIRAPRGGSAQTVRLTSRPGQWIFQGWTVAAVARRARTENFPVASILFPRRLRPHLRALYCFARLVDVLGDEFEGDRLAALDELEREVDACYGGEPHVAGAARTAADRSASSLCRASRSCA